jgi:hypothetical protein
VKLSKKDIQVVNSKRSARPGKIYSTFDGTKYVGQNDGSLDVDKKSNKERQAEKAQDKKLVDLSSEIENLKEEDKAIRELISKTECKLIAMNIVLG